MEIHDAVQKGDLEAIKALIADNPANRDWLDHEQKSPAYLAVQSGHMEIVRYLVAEQGADINQPNANGLPALFWAISVNDYDMVQCLVDVGANINYKARKEQTALNFILDKIRKSRSKPDKDCINIALCLIGNGSDLPNCASDWPCQLLKQMMEPMITHLKSNHRGSFTDFADTELFCELKELLSCLPSTRIHLVKALKAYLRSYAEPASEDLYRYLSEHLDQRLLADLPISSLRDLTLFSLQKQKDLPSSFKKLPTHLKEEVKFPKPPFMP